MQPIYGRLSDIFGRKFVLLGSLVIFLIGSLACGVAQVYSPFRCTNLHRLMTRSAEYDSIDHIPRNTGSWWWGNTDASYDHQ